MTTPLLASASLFSCRVRATHRFSFCDLNLVRCTHPTRPVVGSTCVRIAKERPGRAPHKILSCAGLDRFSESRPSRRNSGATAVGVSANVPAGSDRRAGRVRRIGRSLTPHKEGERAWRLVAIAPRPLGADWPRSSSPSCRCWAARPTARRTSWSRRPRRRSPRPSPSMPRSAGRRSRATGSAGNCHLGTRLARSRSS